MSAYVVEIEGHTYRIDTPNVFDSIDLTTKMTPILLALKDAPSKEALKAKFGEFFIAFGRNLSAEDKNDIMRICLSAVVRKNKTNWTPIWRNGNLMYHDINMRVMLMIIWAVLDKSEVLDFFSQNPLIFEAAMPLDQEVDQN